jgi:xylan 1,4-beta-xylosidase
MKATRALIGRQSLAAIVWLACWATPPAHAATAQNPILWGDVPDPDVIRVGNAYYMVSTTMHFNPGVPVMKSTDLVNWEVVNYVYDTLENGDRQNLNNGQNEYGQGSWASSLRFRNGTFYVVFVSLSSGRTYIYRTTNIETGPWTRSTLNSVYHDPSLLFDDDGRVYLIYGGDDIRIIELTADATAIRSGGLNQVIIPDAGSIAGSGGLPAEGAHAYKIDGRYYVFLISWPAGSMRTELVYRASSVAGPYVGQVALRNSGIAQGGVVNRPDGQWYAMLFQDKSAVGRIPYLMPITWSNGWPVFGNPFDTGISVNLASRFVASDEFDGGPRPGVMWQWNHNPDNTFWSLTSRPGFLRLTNGGVRASILNARNTLTQRTFGPESSAVVALETGAMRDGDYAGLAAFQFFYGFVGVKMSGATRSIVMVRGSTNNPNQGSVPVEVASVPISQSRVYLRMHADYRNQTDRASFFYSLDGSRWTAIGEVIQMVYTLPHFVGYRFGLFNYATRTAGGFVDFDYFRIEQPPPGGELLTNGDMESGTVGWTVFGSGALSSNTSVVHGGARSLLLTGRTAAWNGVAQNVTSKVTNGRTFTTNVWCRTQGGTPSAKVTLAVTANGSTSYIQLAPPTTVGPASWTLLSGTAPVSWSGTLSSALLYVETSSGTDSFYVDDVSFR